MTHYPHVDYPNFNFEVTHTSADGARLGRLTTPHGTISTPNYIFCGTKAAIKGLSPQQMHEANTDIILSNAYHLMIQPGADLIQKMGGLHKFTGWNGPMLTDSGGFQVFSMGNASCADEIKGTNRPKREDLLKITEEGAEFRSYLDGRKLMLNPEISMDIQRKLGADLIVQMDECTPYQVSKEYTAKSMDMSMRWGDRSLSAFERMHDGSQGLYGVVQGGIYDDLRQQSAQYVACRPFFGTAIGGCLGGDDDEMYGILETCRPFNHPTRPIHFLGIGRIKDVFKSVRCGIDTFDCVMPTRIARHGHALMRGGPSEKINLLNAKYKDDPEPLDPSLDIPCSRDFSKAYIHHLFKAGELLAYQIVTQHNVAMINRLMTEVRAAIKNGTLTELEREWLPG
ncbi:MAG: tRNA guanosine(34) transglycosylase Tgt [Rhodospirillales bacterium]|nr:tRNA guanosine(34) transglycosylase Tgt [Rhodospirillales bacterium]MCB9972976.1 tRNA guanosine(34) transglycosylase Tgt [Rhodospirillales bacterium]MCB9980036.1 tRNA guanosine(34) transglycosylase Tgt [Rhodospirillales bacterium]